MSETVSLYFLFSRVIDVGSEWSTFNNNGSNASRIGEIDNGTDLSNNIGPPQPVCHII